MYVTFTDNHRKGSRLFTVYGYISTVVKKNTYTLYVRTISRPRTRFMYFILCNNINCMGRQKGIILYPQFIVKPISGNVITPWFLTCQ